MLTPKARKGYRRIDVVTTLEVPEDMTDREAVLAINDPTRHLEATRQQIKRANFKKLTASGGRTKY